jgi:hypothetical protein
MDPQISTGKQSPSSRAQEYQKNGFLVERALFSPEEARALGEVFMAMHAKGGVAGRYAPHDPGEDFDDKFHYVFKAGDPLHVYPRVMWPHAFMPEAKKFVLDGRIFDLLEEVLGEEALSISSMFYFKPPKAKGQAFHQDNFYIRVKPGTCIAVWVACEDSDEGNGALQVVPGSQNLEIACPEISDPTRYFAKELVRPPEGMTAVMPCLKAGDALVFHGNLIHGSEPNDSKDRFRRSLVCHYMPVSSLAINRYDDPLLDRQGNPHRRAEAEGGGPCGNLHDDGKRGERSTPQ